MIDLTSFLHFQKNNRIFHWRGFLKNSLLTTFSLFYQRGRRVIFQVNTQFLISQLKTILTQGTLHLSFMVKTFSSLHCRIFKKKSFYHIFTSFESEQGASYFRQILTVVISQQKINIFTKDTWTHLFAMHLFSTTLKHKKTIRFPHIFMSRERMHWEQMDYQYFICQNYCYYSS